MVKRKQGWQRGDIVMVDFNPAVGSEQREPRPALILTKKLFNDLGMAFVAPVTQGGNYARHAGFTVSLSGSGSKTQGVVLLNQARMIDLNARDARFVEVLDEAVVNDVLLRFSTLVEAD
ncbi:MULTISPECIES: type II toxin-antitoxin system ChpB family toxin [unclassified Enterobacter]|jgi:mRNA interferase ChpB|uniref:type II toxin-antitoxin system ChpB family toxin n=1 Tax=unclassified Enterobacter TaxID=2608935 RepID=UPI000933E3F4|nr:MULTISPECIES: type II toxin-antitoxin system ChpB family toxin [unclassified Enterobacter]WJD50644.1 type II toxin-antitoxin system ChpB family toxin [Enterobacter sp. PGRG2]